MSTLAAASTASSSSTSSPRCVPFAFRRGARGRLPAPIARTASVTHGGAPAPAAAAAAAGGCCGRPLCCLAEVLGKGIQNAFFASLDVCSCVSISTISIKESESDAAPLMSPLPSPPPHDVARSGGRRRASAGGKPRRGLGCCTPSSTSVN